MSSKFTVDSMLRAEILSKAIVGQPPYKAVIEAIFIFFSVFIFPSLFL